MQLGGEKWVVWDLCLENFDDRFLVLFKSNSCYMLSLNLRKYIIKNNI